MNINQDLVVGEPDPRHFREISTRVSLYYIKLAVLYSRQWYDDMRYTPYLRGDAVSNSQSETTAKLMYDT